MFAGNLSLSPFISSQFTPLQPKIAKKITKKTFLGFRTIILINIDNPKKLVASACYDKQHVCAYLQPFSR